MPFSKIRIVLIETSHPGNIGAAARAMKNMGLSRLSLVQPRQFPSAEATSRASGADDLLANAVVTDTLEEAIADCSLVIGASARLRSLSWPQLDVRECAAEVLRGSEGGEEIAILFGREHSGLTNEELERCQYLMHIPTNPEYSSLNLAQAVQVMAYELRVGLGKKTEAGEEETEYATGADLEGFFEHLEQTLVDIDFLDPDNPRQVMRRLKRLFSRTRIEKVEHNILRGILTAAQKAVGKK